MFDLELSAPEKAEFLEAARLAGTWLLNNQFTVARPWGRVATAQCADLGRFAEKVAPARDRIRPAGVWLQGIYLCGLIDLKKTPLLRSGDLEGAIELGARFLKSLQCFDVRWPKAIGGFYETWPGDPYSAPRDAASGAFGLIALYLETGDDEFLDRAVRFAEWYSTHGSDADGYPWDDYSLEKGEGTSRLRGDWQAGGALIYYQLWRLTGDERWRAALDRVLAVFETVCANDPGTDTAYDFHGSNTISIGNDDFANVALLAGHVASGQRSYLELAGRRLRAELGRQAPSGAFPGYGGTFVTALELLEALDLGASGVEVLPADELVEPLLRAVRFSLGLQEKTSHDRFVLGGVYGESNYATSRDVVHGRDTSYALQLWMRLAGYRASTYTVLGWEDVGEAKRRHTE